MKVDFANLNYQYRLYKEEIDAAMQEVLESGKFILGPHVAQLEEQLAAFVEAPHCLTCSSGTDALQLALMAVGIGPGDEVVTTPFTFIATAEMIAHLGATPVFVDIEPDAYNIDPAKIEAAITPRTKALLPVSLYGQPADFDAIHFIAERQGEKGRPLAVIEDAAQSFGATYKGRKSGALAPIGCTSFFPAKPLGCFGDGGAVFTTDAAVAETLRCLRVHGQNARYKHKYIGLGARLDTLQAAVLLAKFPHYSDEVHKRQHIARHYTELLQDRVRVPQVLEDRSSVWAQYSIRVPYRDTLRQRLADQGVPTAVHYPMPLHLQQCFAYLGYGPGDFPVAEAVSAEILSLPMNPFLTEAELQWIAACVMENLSD